jgi:hypothetical protein
MRSVGLRAEVWLHLLEAFRSGQPGLYGSRFGALDSLLHGCETHDVSLGEA